MTDLALEFVVIAYKWLNEPITNGRLLMYIAAYCAITMYRRRKSDPVLDKVRKAQYSPKEFRQPK